MSGGGRILAGLEEMAHAEAQRRGGIECNCLRVRGTNWACTVGCPLHGPADLTAEDHARRAELEADLRVSASPRETIASAAMGSGSSPEHSAGGLGDFIKGMVGQVPPSGRLFEVALAAGEARFTVTGCGIGFQLDQATAIALRDALAHGITHCQTVHCEPRLAGSAT